ncbi:hypothetical protein L6452_40122 [Arctium lappa]|uniref:Uncharacterized protein n=1 Tax=Arctium lappa TaxID=4217 RepID=A0ACB8XLM7_ARCLA|nr:hypothetical protein L6452_40122 [Arctium lappa]
MFDGTIRTLSNVKFVPFMTRSLISIGQLSKLGCKIRIENESMRISRGNFVVMNGEQAENNLFHLVGDTVSSDACVADSSRNLDATRLWHLRLGHTSEKNLEILRKRKLIAVDTPTSLDFCSECVSGKQTRVSFGAGKHNTNGILDYVHTDVWGPSSTHSLSGSKYYVTFIDDFSHKLWVYVIKLKSDVFEIFKTWLALVEVETGRKLKVLRSDNGGEYTSGNFKDFCSRRGIHRHYTTPGDPQSNGVAERMNMTLLKKVRCMLVTSGFPKMFWAEALHIAVHIVNQLPCSAIGGKIPEEIWRGKGCICLKYIRVFGSPAYIHVTGQDKLDLRATKGFLLSYTDESAIQVKVIHSRHVTFDESIMFKSNHNRKPAPEPEIISSVSPTTDGDEIIIGPIVPNSSACGFTLGLEFEEDVSPPDTSTSDPVSSVQEEILNDGGGQGDTIPVSVPTRQIHRTIRPPNRYGDWDFANMSFTDQLEYVFHVVQDDPFDYSEALASSHCDKLLGAMHEEMEALSKNNTWELCPLPKGSRAIGCKWVYKVKDDKRYKARLVVKGFAQRKGIEYDDIFAPVVRHTSIRVLLALVEILDLELEQLDVKTAFLHGDLEETIYMKQPEGFISDNKPDWVYQVVEFLFIYFFMLMTC